MISVRKLDPPERAAKRAAESAPAPRFVPRPKHPLALALCTAALAAWIAFLAYLAYRG